MNIPWCAFVIAALVVTVTVFCPGAGAQTDVAPPDAISYRSPYSVRLPWSDHELIPDLIEGERGDRRFEATIPESAWYNHSRVGPWGPPARAYGPPPLAAGKSDDWKRARIIATALRFVGYAYRHHHVPDWNPPTGWHIPEPGGVRHDGRGVDCSNFTSFVYNQGLGIGISSDVQKQSAARFVSLHGSDRVEPVTILHGQDSYALWVSVLKPGDLLFIRPRTGTTISHVVIWIGAWGFPQDEPLVLDSHGADVRDSAGNRIPAGIYLRPFRFSSWYATNADHAIRIIGPESAVEGQP